MLFCALGGLVAALLLLLLLLPAPGCKGFVYRGSEPLFVAEIADAAGVGLYKHLAKVSLRRAYSKYLSSRCKIFEEFAGYYCGSLRLFAQCEQQQRGALLQSYSL